MLCSVLLGLRLNRVRCATLLAFVLSASITLCLIILYASSSGSSLLRASINVSSGVLTDYERLAKICERLGESTLASASSIDKCDLKLRQAVPAVACEIRLNFHDSSNPIQNGTSEPTSEASTVAFCLPRVRIINCSMLADSSLPCYKDFEIEEYDFHTQHHCINKLVDNMIRRNESIPRLLHYVWYYSKSQPLEFHSYLGLFSTVRFLGADALFVWNDGFLPSNQWWQEFISQFNQAPNLESLTLGPYKSAKGKVIPQRKVPLFGKTKIYSIFRRRPTHIYSNRIDQEYHKSDVTRLDALLLYGGLYIDTDVVSLRDLTPLLSHQAVMGREDSPTVPTIGNAIIYAARNASYMNIWHHTYKTFDPTEWAAHSTVGNNLLAEECSRFVHIEDSSLMKPGNHWLLYRRDESIASNYMLHLWMRWRSDSHEILGPDDLIDWRCTVGRILRGLFFGTCDVCG